MKLNNSEFSSLKYPLFLKLFLSIYVFLTLCSVCYLLSVHHFIDISLLYQRLFSLGYGYWVAISFIVAQIGMGRVLFRLPFLRDLKLSGLTYLLFSLGGGFYVSYCLLMLLALLNCLNGPGILIYLLPAILFIYLGYKSIKEVILSYHKKINLSPQKKKINKRIIIIGLLILIWIIPYFIQTLLPNTDWDGDSFHLPQAKRFLNGEISSADAYYHPYDYPGAIHLSYALLLFFKAETAIIPFNFIFALFTILTVYCISAHFWTRKVGFLAVLICIAVNLLWEVSLTPRIDVYLTFFFILSFFSFLLWVKNKVKEGFLIYVGLFLGITVGIKYTAAIFILVLFPIVIILFFLNKNKLKLSFIPLISLIVTLTLPSIYWYGRNYFHLGNPIYPFISGPIFIDKEGNIKDFENYNYLWESLPKKSEFNKQKLNRHDLNFLFNTYIHQKKPKTLFNIYDILTHPDNYQDRDYHEVNLFVFFILLLPFFSRKKNELWLFGLSLLFYCIISIQTWVLRYALPIFPLFAIGSSVVISHIKSKKILNTVFILIFINFFTFSLLEWQKLTEAKPISYFFNNDSRIEWLIKVGYNYRLLDTPLAIKFINESIENKYISKNDTLFMVGECKGYLINCNYFPDPPSHVKSRWIAELMKSNFDYNKLKKKLIHKNIKYILYNDSYFRVISSKHPQSDRKIMKFSLFHLFNFLNTYTSIIYDDRGIIVAKIINSEKNGI